MDTAPAGGDSAALGPDRQPLTDRELELLAFERHWWRYAGAKEQAIKETFGFSTTRYYQLLGELIDRPEALGAGPDAGQAPAQAPRRPPARACGQALRHASLTCWVGQPRDEHPWYGSDLERSVGRRDRARLRRDPVPDRRRSRGGPRPSRRACRPRRARRVRQRGGHRDRQAGGHRARARPRAGARARPGGARPLRVRAVGERPDLRRHRPPPACRGSRPSCRSCSTPSACSG